MSKFISIANDRGSIEYVNVDLINRIYTVNNDTAISLVDDLLYSSEDIDYLMNRINQLNTSLAVDVMKKFAEYIKDKPACFNRNSSNVGADLMVSINGEWHNAIEQFIKETYK